MTGKEFKEYLESQGIPIVSLARKMNIAPQVVSNKFQRQSIKPEFLSKAKSAIEELHASWGVSKENNDEKEVDIVKVLSKNEALQREVEILREQNKFLQNMLDRLTLPKTQTE